VRIGDTNNNERIKSYYFVYKTGEFEKTLLCGFCEVDQKELPTEVAMLEALTLNRACDELKNSNLLKKHFFDYYDDIKTSSGIFQMFSPYPVTLNTTDDHIPAILKNGKYTMRMEVMKRGVLPSNWMLPVCSSSGMEILARSLKIPILLLCPMTNK